MKNPPIKSGIPYITRTENKSWWVRVNNKAGHPENSKTFHDSKYGGPAESLAAAIHFRDKHRKPEGHPDLRRGLPYNPIPGLCLAHRRQGKGRVYAQFQVAFTVNKRTNIKPFAFWKSGLILETFEKAARFAMEKFPYHDIDLSDMNGLFQTYLERLKPEVLEQFLEKHPECKSKLR